jgi:protein-S-isoprenylcysteine O-methyltransferase Ste14
MKSKDVAGYIMGLLLFVILIPLIMWRLSGEADPGTARIVCLAVLSAAGLGLSIWSIVYMKRVGKGNPMDAFNHEVAPRTANLMTDGPYRICRNPMLLGVLIYYAGIIIFLGSWQAVTVFVIYCAIMMIQVRAEEKRLEQDFGEAYKEYCRKTKKLIPFIW